MSIKGGPEVIKDDLSIFLDANKQFSVEDYLIYEDFEHGSPTLGYGGWSLPRPKGWFGSEVNWEDSYNPISGVSSMTWTNTNAAPSVYFEPQKEAWIYFARSVLSGTDYGFGYFRGVGDGNYDRASYYINRVSGTAVALVETYYAREASAPTGTLNLTGLNYFWLHYKKGNGNNAIFEGYVSSTPIRPSNPTLGIYNGLKTYDVDSFCFQSNENGGNGYYGNYTGGNKIDNVRISPYELGDYGQIVKWKELSQKSSKYIPKDYFVYEDFENTGIPVGWTTGANTSSDVFYNTSSPISGTASFNWNNSNQSVHAYFPRSSNVWVFSAYKTSATYAEVLSISDGATILSQNAYWGTGLWRFNCQGHDDLPTDTVNLQAQTLFLWLNYQAGTGNNSKLHCYRSTTPIRPQTAFWSWSNGNATGLANELYLNNGGGNDGKYDCIRISDKELGDYGEIVQSSVASASLKSGVSLCNPSDQKSYLFDGINDYIDLNIPNLTGEVATVETWLKLSPGYSGKNLMNFGSYSISYTGGNMGFSSSNSDLFGFSGSAVQSLNCVDNWKHFVYEMHTGQYTGNKIYVDSVEQTLNQISSTGLLSRMTFNTGVAQLGYLMPMECSSFRAYNRTLTPKEILKNYNAQKGKFVKRFLPNQISNLKIWLKADSLSLNNGDPVGTWADSSTNGNNAIQSGSSSVKPTFKTNILCGRPALRFDGNDSMSIALTTIPSPYTVFIVTANIISNGNEAEILYGSSFGGCIFYRDSKELGVYAGGVATWLTNLQTLASPSVVGVVYNSTNSKVSINGQTVTTILATNNIGTSYIIGSFINQSQNYSKVDIAEIIVYSSALSDKDRVSVQNYLGNKYAIPISN